MKSLFRFTLPIQVLCCSLTLTLAACGPSTHRYKEAAFTLPTSWSRTAAPVPGTYAAVDGSRDGYDLFMVVHQPFSGNPAAIPAADFKRIANRIADKSIERMRTKEGMQNVKERSRGTGAINGIPVMEQVVEARMSWPDGQRGDAVMSSRVYTKKGGVYNFTLRESAESHRTDPGYFKRLVDTVRFE